MIYRDLMDNVVSQFRSIEASLYGDDSPLADAWEEFKDLVQNDRYFYLEPYYQTLRAAVDQQVAQLNERSLAQCMEELKASSREKMRSQILNRLASRARKEKVHYDPFEFQYFRHSAFGFSVYLEVLKRTGMTRCEARGYSVAAPGGERGTVELMEYDQTLVGLSKDEFESARALNWP